MARLTWLKTMISTWRRRSDVRTVLADTSALVALVSEKDASHGAAQRTFQLLLGEGAALYTTNLVVAETYTLVLRKLGSGVARDWLTQLNLPVIRVTFEDEQRAVEIITTPTAPSSNQFHAYSYFDATSFAVMERLGSQDAFAFDRHFRLAGFNVLGL